MTSHLYIGAALTAVADLSDEALAEAFERGCSLAAALYERGLDTADADAAVDLILSHLRERGLA